MDMNGSWTAWIAKFHVSFRMFFFFFFCLDVCLYEHLFWTIWTLKLTFNVLWKQKIRTFSLLSKGFIAKYEKFMFARGIMRTFNCIIRILFVWENEKKNNQHGFRYTLFVIITSSAHTILHKIIYFLWVGVYATTMRFTLIPFFLFVV